MSTEKPKGRRVPKTYSVSKTLVTIHKDVLKDLGPEQIKYLHRHRPTFTSDVIRLMMMGMNFKDAAANCEREHNIANRHYGRWEPLDGDEFLKGLEHRSEVRDPEAYDIDAKLYNNLEAAIVRFKRTINWELIRETIGKGPHGLYYRRLANVLDSTHPKLWRGCKCNLGPRGNQQMACPFCRGGGYTIGKP